MMKTLITTILVNALQQKTQSRYVKIFQTTGEESDNDDEYVLREKDEEEEEED